MKVTVTDLQDKIDIVYGDCVSQTEGHTVSKLDGSLITIQLTSHNVYQLVIYLISKTVS